MWMLADAQPKARKLTPGCFRERNKQPPPKTLFHIEGFFILSILCKHSSHHVCYMDKYKQHQRFPEWPNPRNNILLANSRQKRDRNNVCKRGK
jgi:hypothetical protein